MPWCYGMSRWGNPTEEPWLGAGVEMLLVYLLCFSNATMNVDQGKKPPK